MCYVTKEVKKIIINTTETIIILIDLSKKIFSQNLFQNIYLQVRCRYKYVNKKKFTGAQNYTRFSLLFIDRRMFHFVRV